VSVIRIVFQTIGAIVVTGAALTAILSFVITFFQGPIVSVQWKWKAVGSIAGVVPKGELLTGDVENESDGNVSNVLAKTLVSYPQSTQSSFEGEAYLEQSLGPVAGKGQRSLASDDHPIMFKIWPDEEKKGSFQVTTVVCFSDSVGLPHRFKSTRHGNFSNDHVPTFTGVDIESTRGFWFQVLPGCEAYWVKP
jgi:hypothetical protein